MISPRSLLAFAAPDSRTRSAPEGKSWRKRFTLLLAAITVPAMAAPDISGGSFGSLPGPAVESTAALATRNAAKAALPFERPGMSFPGSAFYYMADPAGAALLALPASNPLGNGTEDGRPLGALIDVGSAAKPFFAVGTGITPARAQECLAQAVWYEAASESEAGQRAVAQVVLNRVAHPSWPSSVCGVVYQGADRSTGCQFSFTCDGSLARRPSGESWMRAQRIATQALSGSVYTPVGLATHYHTLWVDPYWTGRLDHIGTIGAHRFYRNRGIDGQAAAFRAAYAGMEPAVSGRRNLAAVTTAIAGPVETATTAYPAIADAVQTSPSKAVGDKAAASPSAGMAGAPPVETYGGTGAIKAEYARAGQWKARPGTPPATTPDN